MYADFLRFLLAVIETLDDFEKKTGVPDTYGDYYLGTIPVKYDGEVVGELRDEVGGAWSFIPKESA